jgi:hypothetical protein
LARGAASFAVAVASAPAWGTWSIVMFDSRTREVAVGSATCVSGSDLRARTPVVVAGVGGATTQSLVEPNNFNRTLLRDRMVEGMDPEQILGVLSQYDTSHQRRQYGIVDAAGRAATFSGSQTGGWAGGQTGSVSYVRDGQVGVITYAVQGNLLTGAPVVQAAVDVIRTFDGDMPARLMAAMEAAKSMGGDGRCSCDIDNAEACGSPPALFTQSALIGYVIVARLGDRDRCGPVYGVGSIADIDVGRLDDDALPDVVVADAFSKRLLTYRNLWRVGRGATVFGLPVAAGDLSGAGAPAPVASEFVRTGAAPFLVGAYGGAGQDVRTFRALGANVPLVATTVFARTITALAAHDMTGDGRDEVVVVGRDGPGVGFVRVSRVKDDGGLEMIAERGLDFEPGAVDVAGSVVSSTRRILVGGALAGAAGLRVIEATPGGGGVTLGAPTSVALASAPISVAAGDLDGDGDDDAIVGLGSSFVQWLRADVSGLAAQAAQSAGTSSQGVAIGDMDRDGIGDAVVAGSSAIAVLRGGVGGPTFSGAMAVNVGQGAPFLRGAALADMDSDADLDVVARDSQFGAWLYLENRGAPAGQAFGAAGTFVSVQGCGEGDYFLSLNVANASFASPDAVTRLRQSFDTWRAGLNGRPDAVLSTAHMPTDLSPGGATRDLIVTLRDWRGQPITVAIANLRVTRDAGDEDGSSVVIGAPVALGGGVFRVPLTPTIDGADALRVTAEFSGRPVTLSPLPVAVVRRGCDGVDFNQDNVFPDLVDAVLFFDAFAGGACPAFTTCNDIDFNNDGVFPDLEDVRKFVEVFGGGGC